MTTTHVIDTDDGILSVQVANGLVQLSLVPASPNGSLEEIGLTLPQWASVSGFVKAQVKEQARVRGYEQAQQ